eukprot:2544965-Pleurochrysis_carterae.AAC.2
MAVVVMAVVMVAAGAATAEGSEREGDPVDAAATSFPFLLPPPSLPTLFTAAGSKARTMLVLQGLQAIKPRANCR